MIDFRKYKENISVDAFVAIVSKDIIKGLDDITKQRLKNGVSIIDAHFSHGLLIRNSYIYPYLEKHKFGGKKVPDVDSISMMILSKVIEKVGGHLYV